MGHFSFYSSPMVAVTGGDFFDLILHYMSVLRWNLDGCKVPENRREFKFRNSFKASPKI